MKLSSSPRDAVTEPADKPHPVLERYYALDPERRRPARLIVASIAVLAGVLLLLLAVPRLFAAIELLDARSTAERAEVDAAKLTAAQLESTAGALRHALEWQDDADLAALAKSIAAAL